MSNERTYDPIQDSSAWKGSDLQNSSAWLTRLDTAEVAEIETALDGVEARGLGVGAIGKEEFPLPLLGPKLAEIATELEHGRGFALLRGLPVLRWGADRAALAYCGLSAHIGTPVSQNREGDLILPVRDAGQKAGELNVRGPATNAKLYYHSDFADIVGLMCMHPAMEGGVSRICSSIAIYNALLEAGRKDLIDAFYDGYLFDRKGEELPGLPPVSEAPVPMLSWYRGKLSFRYVPGWAETATKRLNQPWTALKREAIDEVNRLSNSEEFFLDMDFQAGDVQFLNNYSVLHSRTAFVDFPEPERKRYLQRIWLRAHKGRELAPDFDHLFGPASTRDGIPAWTSERPQAA